MSQKNDKQYLEEKNSFYYYEQHLNVQLTHDVDAMLRPWKYWSLTNVLSKYLCTRYNSTNGCKYNQTLQNNIIFAEIGWKIANNNCSDY